jgi:6-phosphogluconolactonase
LKNMSRRAFMKTASAATLASAALPGIALARRQRVFVASNTPDGILAYDWDPAGAELTPAGVAAKISTVDWITFSPRQEYLYAAAEVDTFNGRPTGEVASFRVENGALHPYSSQNSASTGTCHLALDHTGSVLVSADYGGGSVASFRIAAGRLSPAAYTEHYLGHGPVADRQQAAHAHFASFSPDNRFAYINDLGSDCIHIYSLDTATARLTPAGIYRAHPGAGPRTLHFHPNGHTAYSVNEIDSTVDVLEWSKMSGQLALVKRFDLLPKDYHGPSTACDTVIPRDGRNVYFANRDNDFLFSFKADPKTGSLTPMVRSSCGGKTPRNFVLDPTERWMLVANQDSNQISVFARDPESGLLADKGRSFRAAVPMCILFAS